ncbi:MAG: alpha-amylase, partial [Bacteroidales bacterium]|nr:alpha-amylase [Bacteroidales bacterium]
LLFWASKGVDGFRCDMAEMVPVEFWHWAIDAVKRVHPNINFIAEVYNPSLYDSYLNWGGFDYLYDKVGLYDTLKSITRGEAAAHSITGCWQSLGDMQYSMLNFLENHDEQRVASDFNIGNPFKAVPELAVSLMFNTAPFMLYFGQEFGERGMLSEGFSGVDGRTSIFDYCSAPSVVRYLANSLSSQEKRLYSAYKHLFKLVMGEEALRVGSTYDLEYANFQTPGFDSGCCFAFARKSGTSLIVVAVDFSQTKTSLSVNLPSHLFEFWSLTPGYYSMQNLSLLPCSVNSYNEPILMNFSPNTPVHLQTNEYGIAIIKITLL